MPPTAHPFQDLAERVLEAAAGVGLGVLVTTPRDGTMQVVHATEALGRILGYPVESLIGLDGMSLVAPEARAAGAKLVERRLRGEAVPTFSETVLIHRDGHPVPVMVGLSQTAFGGRDANVMFVWDLSATKRAESSLQAKDLSFRVLIEGAPDGVVISRRGVVLYANPAASRMLGVESAEALAGQSLESFLVPEDAAAMRTRVEQVMRTGKTSTPSEYRARRGDGAEVIAEITSLPFVFEGAPAVLAFARDVTERAQLRAQLARADKLAALGTLSAGVAHEINNPMATISLATEAIERLVLRGMPEGGTRTETLRLLRELGRSGDRVTGIVRDLRSFARTNPDDVQPADVRTVLASTERMTAHAIRHTAQLHIDCGVVSPVTCDAGRLEQVLVNLLLNAAQAFPKHEPHNRIEVQAQALGESMVELTVKDNGPGMTPAVQARVFDPFFTTKPAGIGTGLGLFISHNIITQVGGSLTVTSQVGVGTTMRIVLPVAQGSRAPQGQPTGQEPRPPQPRSRILLIDDEASLLFTLKLVLQEAHDVTTASSAEEGLRLLSNDAGFDLILCDLMMEPMGGIELHQRLSEQRPEVAKSMVFMSGGAFTPMAANFLAQVPNRRLEKPFLASAIEALLAR